MRTETFISMEEARDELPRLLDLARRVPEEKQSEFVQFWRGVAYGLDLTQNAAQAGGAENGQMV